MGNRQTLLQNTKFSSHENSTKLYALIDSQSWGLARAQCLKHPKEAAVWTTARLYGADRKVLPLHRAVSLNPPAYLIDVLVEAYAEGVSSTTLTISHKDKQQPSNNTTEEESSDIIPDDWLPLQIAVHFDANFAVISKLLEVYGEAARCRNKVGRLPLHTACRHLFIKSISEKRGSSVVKVLHRAFPAAAELTCEKGFRPIDYIMQLNTNNSKEKMEKEKAIRILTTPKEDIENISVDLSSQQQARRKNKDINSTKLYQLVKRKEWVNVSKRCSKNPKEASLPVVDSDSDAPTMFELQIPLHLACALKAPLDTVQNLHKAYPDGIKTRGVRQMLPLHLCILNHAPFDVISYVITSFPAACKCADTTGLIPLHFGCSEGSSLDIIQLLLSTYPEGVQIKDNNEFLPVDYCKASMYPNKDEILIELMKYNENEHVPSVSRGKVVQKERPSKMDRGYSVTSSFHLVKKPVSDQATHNPSATDLFNFVTMRDWRSALNQLLMSSESAKKWCVDLEEEQKRLPLHIACSRNPPLPLIDQFRKTFPDAFKVPDFDGKYPLHLLIESKSTPLVIEYALRAFPRAASSKDSNGSLPLHLAVSHRCQERVIEALVESNTESKVIEDNNGKTPLMLARASGTYSKHILEVLGSPSFELSKKFSDRFIVAEEDDLEAELSCQIESHLNFKSKDVMNDKETRRRSYVEEMASTGSGTQLFNLILKRDWELVEKRVKIHQYESSMWVEWKEGTSLPLLMACQLNPPLATIIALCDAFPNALDMKDDDGKLPIHLACEYRASSDVVVFLLRMSPIGAQSSDKFGRLPLHLACMNGSCNDVLEALVDVYEGGLTSRDQSNKLPLDYSGRDHQLFRLNSHKKLQLK